MSCSDGVPLLPVLLSAGCVLLSLLRGIEKCFGALHLHDCASLFAVAESRYAELMLACTIDFPTCCRYDTGSYAAYVLGDFSFIYLQVSTTRGGGGGRDGHDCTTLTINSRALAQWTMLPPAKSTVCGGDLRVYVHLLLRVFRVRFVAVLRTQVCGMFAICVLSVVVFLELLHS